jgi:hypothetical protein
VILRMALQIYQAKCHSYVNPDVDRISVTLLLRQAKRVAKRSARYYVGQCGIAKLISYGPAQNSFFL